MAEAKTYEVPNNGSSMPIIYYSQGTTAGGGDWATLSYGSSNIANCGCGITSLAMVISYMNNAIVTPADVRQKLIDEWGSYNAFYVGNQGLDWSAIPEIAQKYNLVCNDIDYSEVQGELLALKPVIQICGKGIFTGGGHFIVLTGKTQNGFWRVNDPNGNHASFSFTNFALNTILNEGKGGWWSFENNLPVHGNYPNLPNPPASVEQPENTAEQDYRIGWIYGNRYLSQSEMENNAQKVFNYFIGQGWSYEAIAGMLGNMEYESNINPGLWQNRTYGTGGYGLTQWTPASKYINWAGSEWENNGAKECERIQWELDNNEQWQTHLSHPMTFQQFYNSTNTPEYLAEVFLYNYEMPDNPASKINERATSARRWYNFILNIPVSTTTPSVPTYPIIPQVPYYEAHEFRLRNYLKPRWKRSI